MAKITYNTHDSKTYTIEVQNGLTVMEGAVQNDIPGIDADCGGGMACATCHVYVNEEWLSKLPVKEDGEEDMLDMAFEPKQNVLSFIQTSQFMIFQQSQNVQEKS
jgi:2Fe-2S ferredoxin